MTEMVEHVGPDGEIRRLPAGERVLWSGAPDRCSLARFFLRERLVLAFVALSFVIGAADALQHADGAIPRLIGVATLSAILTLVAIFTTRMLAWLIARSSTYVITERRVYFNIGIVLRADANIPYSSVQTIDLRRHSDGSADLMITLTDAQEIPWLLLFPHMTWRGTHRGRPTFRALRQPQVAADAIVGALKDFAAPATTADVATATAVPSPGCTAIMAGTPSPA